MGAAKHYQSKLAKLAEKVFAIEDRWSGWECIETAVKTLEGCIDAYVPTGFTLPARIVIRGAKTHVWATDVRLPDDWTDVLWTWSVDDEELRETHGPEVDLPTGHIAPGEHTLSVVVRPVRAGTVIARAIPGLSAAPAPTPPAPAPPAAQPPAIPGWPYRVREIEGIDEVLASRLEQQGIGTTEDLLTKAATPLQRRDLARTTGIPERRLLHFANQADLMRVDGVAGQYADLLRAANVHTTRQLATRNPDALKTALSKAVTVGNGTRVGRLPGQDEVERWIKHAQELPQIDH